MPGAVLMHQGGIWFRRIAEVQLDNIVVPDSTYSLTIRDSRIRWVAEDDEENLIRLNISIAVDHDCHRLFSLAFIEDQRAAGRRVVRTCLGRAGVRLTVKVKLLVPLSPSARLTSLMLNVALSSLTMVPVATLGLPTL